MKTTKLVTCHIGLTVPEKIAREVDRQAKLMPKGFGFTRRTLTLKSAELLEGERADVSWVTTKSIDLDSEIVDTQGINLDLYQKNPIVLYNHDPEKVIGRCAWIKRAEDGIRAKTLYAKRPENYEGNWLADEVFELTKQGILKGKSIGFLPLEIGDPTAEQKSAGCSLVIKRCTMLEYSSVSIPSCPSALVEAVSKGATLEMLGFHPIKYNPKKNHARKLALAIDNITLDPGKIAEQAIQNLRGRV